MTEKRKMIVPLAAALGALAPAIPASNADAAVPPKAAENPAPAKAVSADQVNTVVSTGEDLLGFTIQKNADGTLLAQHYSHSSHASHASHASHFSSR